MCHLFFISLSVLWHVHNGVFQTKHLQHEIWGFHDGENLYCGQVKTEPRRNASLGRTFPHIVCTYNLLHIIAGAGNAPFHLADSRDTWRKVLFAVLL